MEVDAIDGSAEDGGDVVDGVGKRVWNGDAVADAGADEFFAGFESGEGFIAKAWREEEVFGEEVDEFNDGVPMIRGLHFGKDSIHG